MFMAGKVQKNVGLNLLRPEKLKKILLDMSIIKMILADCGCYVRLAKNIKDKCKCATCAKLICDKHARQYVDGNNISITKYALPYCFDCYALKYKRN